MNDASRDEQVQDLAACEPPNKKRTNTEKSARKKTTIPRLEGE